MDRMLQIGSVAALIGGAAWTIKSLTIMAMNANFQPIEGILYFIGVGGILLGTVGLAAFVARRWSGAQRWIAFVAAALAVLIVTSVVSSLIQNAIGDAYTGDNVGIEEEIGILTPGLIWLGIGAWLLARRRRPDPAG